MSEAAALPAGWPGAGERHLASFTSEELVAVGADSPLQGLVTSERVASMGPIPLTAALSAALRGLVARGFVHPEGAATGPASAASPPASADRQLQQLLDRLGEEEGEISVPLSGDLAVVVALRRAPALVCLVSEPSRRDLARRGPLAHRRTDAVLHGVRDERGLGGFLEERRSALGIHAFALRRLEEQTRALCTSLASRAEASDPELPPGRCETAIEVATPDQPDRPSVRLLLAYEPGTPEPGRIAWAAGPGTPATETLDAARLPARLAELLAAQASPGGGTAHLSAS